MYYNFYRENLDEQFKFTLSGCVKILSLNMGKLFF